MTPKQYARLSPAKKAKALADAMDDSANRCMNNLIISGTWIQDTFRGTAERLRELADQIPSKVKR